MDNQIVEAQEPPKTMMMQRKSRVHERIEEDEKELREMMAEREGAEQEAEVQAKEDAEPEGAEEKVIRNAMLIYVEDHKKQRQT